MMTDDENACVRNIVKEIIRELAPRKIKVNKNFVTFLTKLLLINPNWGIGDDFFSQRQNVQRFVDFVIDDMLTQQNNPKIVTLKVQFYFSCNLEHMEYVIEYNKRELMRKLASLRDDILCKTSIAKSDDVELLFNKIVYYITLASGLGNPTQSKVYEEALIALKSILSEEELIEFSSMSKREKFNQLTQFVNVAAGIRLFNKDCGKGGKGIVDLPDLLGKAIEVIRDTTERTLLLIMEKVNLLTTVVDKNYVIRQTFNGYQMECVTSEDLLVKLDIQIEYVKDLLIFFRQYELLIRKILDELDDIRERGAKILIEMEKLLKIIHETVYMKIAIPVGVIFPLFEQLWAIWENFQNQGVLLSRLSMIMSNLETYSQNTYYDQTTIEALIGSNPSLTDAERLSQTADLKLISNNKNVKVVSCDAIKNYQNVKFEFLGFCCWKLIQTDGALIPGNPTMGIAIFKMKYYVFSCVEGFEEFNKDPQVYVNCVLDLMRRKPQLINFFQMRQELESVYNVEKLVESKVEIRVCEDKSMQTVVHVVDSYIEPEYKWNLWELKREALTNAKLLSSVTRSTQTDKTTCNNSVRIQTYGTRSVETQTRKDGSSNVPRPNVFLYGLRGRKDDRQFKIDLTLPLEERRNVI